MACHDQRYAIPCRRYKVLTPTTTIGTVSREFGGPYIEQTDGGLGDADKLACLRPPASTLNTVLVCAGADRQRILFRDPAPKKSRRPNCCGSSLTVRLHPPAPPI